MSRRTKHNLVPISLSLACLLTMLGGDPAGVQTGTRLWASPSGTENAQCIQAAPCSLQGAVTACHMQGVYLDPVVDIHYYRFMRLVGDCNNPQNVILRATRPGTNIIAVQDHAIAAVRCATLDATETATGVNAITTRQHIILDYDRLMVHYPEVRTSR
jgi:hypothetical protein